MTLCLYARTVSKTPCFSVLLNTFTKFFSECHFIKRVLNVRQSSNQDKLVVKMSTWFDFLVIWSFVCISYIASLSDQPNLCGLHSFFMTGIFTVLASIYLIMEPCLTYIIGNEDPSGEVIFEIGEEELNEIPLGPDEKSNIRIDTMLRERIWPGQS
jgi:hypothetical protein